MRARNALTALAVAASIAAAAPAHAETDVAGHWRLDEGTGTTVADSSGNDNHGTLSGDAAWVPGRIGSALDLDGSTGRVTVPDSPTLQPQQVTVSAWVKASASPGRYKYIVAKGAEGCIASSYALYTGPEGGLRFYVSDGAEYTPSPDAGVAIWDDRWHHVAGTYDGSAVRLYVDGVEVGTGTPRVDPIGYELDDRAVYVGHYAGCSGIDYDGAVDEPRIHSRALSAAEVERASKGYVFKGFYWPIDNPPAVNAVEAGDHVPVIFSLTGYQGMGIFTAGSPSSRRVTCDTGAPLGASEAAVPTLRTVLSYSSRHDLYGYVWKTDKSWLHTCRTFEASFVDGTTKTALFRFRKPRN